MATFELPSLPRRRAFINSAAAHLISVGGVAVIGAIVLLMAYLIWVVIPMFVPASVGLLHVHRDVPNDVLAVSTNDSVEVISLIRANGVVEFRDPQSFGMLQQARAVPGSIVDLVEVFGTPSMYAVRDPDNALYFFRLHHDVRYLDDQRVLVHRVEPLFEEIPVRLTEPTTSFDVWREDDQLRVVAHGNDGISRLIEFNDVDDLFELEFPDTAELAGVGTGYSVYWGPRGRWVFEINHQTGDYRLHEVRRLRSIRLRHQASFAIDQAAPTAIGLLLGRYSILSGYRNGRLSQWTLLTPPEGPRFVEIRNIDVGSPIADFASEMRRKGYVALDSNNVAHFIYATSNRNVANLQLADTPRVLQFSPRADRLLAIASEAISLYEVSNPHPEISWSTIWGKVWYEGYEEPVYSWQSSAADTDFEGKFSLTPLLFGTIKAAFYAMLFAIPIAVMGAIYTANFMSPSMRAWVKPGVEIMAALPTVILGFLAGLWLAPIVEANLSAVLLVFLVVPLGTLCFAALWSRLPTRLIVACDGWFGAICVPVVVLFVWLVLANDELLASWLFGGDPRTYLYERLGLAYDQRNALIIGIAMGLAVIPTIFAIAEDAIYGVPQHLVHGSLALGATRWQTLMRVVLLTASPGIFSAIMIGFGRAVGETMIVLMATGNTPILDFNLFQGMRTFAANIAVEMPESEANSTHFRVLFLCALVLFFITFLFNTLAELVRQRLRARYGDL